MLHFIAPLADGPRGLGSVCRGEDNGTGTFVSASDQPPGEEKGSPKGKNRID